MTDLKGDALTRSLNRSSGSDQMNVNGSTPCDQVETSANVFFMLVYSLVFVVGLLLNGFTLKVYFCRAQRQASSSVTVYLKNLAVADFLFCLCLPLRIANFTSRSLHVRHIYCKFGSSAFYLNMYASILFMGYIAANRYLKIVRPFGNHNLLTTTVARIVSTVTWVLLLAFSSTYVILSLIRQDVVKPVPYTVSCDVLRNQKVSFYYCFVNSCTSVLFLLVLGSLLFFYHSTSRRLVQAQQRQPASSGSEKLAKSRRNMSVLVGVFCVCFVPYHLTRLPYAFLSRRCSWSIYLMEATVMVSVLNVCLDPLIYFFFCKAFRAQLSHSRRFRTSRIQRPGLNTAEDQQRQEDGAEQHDGTTEELCHVHI